MPAASPIRCTSRCASPALETSRATMRHSRISEDADEARVSGRWVAIIRSIFFFRLLCAKTLVRRHIFRLNQVNANTLYAVPEIEHSGGAVAQIHDAVANVRTAVIDPDNDP